MSIIKKANFKLDAPCGDAVLPYIVTWVATGGVTFPANGGQTLIQSVNTIDALHSVEFEIDEAFNNASINGITVTYQDSEGKCKGAAQIEDCNLSGVTAMITEVEEQGDSQNELISSVNLVDGETIVTLVSLLAGNWHFSVDGGQGFMPYDLNTKTISYNLSDPDSVMFENNAALWKFTVTDTTIEDTQGDCVYYQAIVLPSKDESCGSTLIFEKVRSKLPCKYLQLTNWFPASFFSNDLTYEWTVTTQGVKPEDAFVLGTDETGNKVRVISGCKGRVCVRVFGLDCGPFLIIQDIDCCVGPEKCLAEIPLTAVKGENCIYCVYIDYTKSDVFAESDLKFYTENATILETYGNMVVVQIDGSLGYVSIGTGDTNGNVGPVKTQCGDLVGSICLANPCNDVTATVVVENNKPEVEEEFNPPTVTIQKA